MLINANMVQDARDHPWAIPPHQQCLEGITFPCKVHYMRQPNSLPRF